MSGILLAIQIALAIIITIAVLLQKSSSIGLGAYSGSNESLFGAKGPAGFLAKTTFVLGIIFVVNTIALGYVLMREDKHSVVIDALKDQNTAPQAPTAPSAATPSSVAPTSPSTQTETNHSK